MYKDIATNNNCDKLLCLILSRATLLVLIKFYLLLKLAESIIKNGCHLYKKHGHVLQFTWGSLVIYMIVPFQRFQLELRILNVAIAKRVSKFYVLSWMRFQKFYIKEHWIYCTSWWRYTFEVSKTVFFKINSLIYNLKWKL